MKYIAQIQFEFSKYAFEMVAVWEDWSYHRQKEYLKKYRDSKKELTTQPNYLEIHHENIIEAQDNIAETINGLFILLNSDAQAKLLEKAKVLQIKMNDDLIDYRRQTRDDLSKKTKDSNQKANKFQTQALKSNVNEKKQLIDEANIARLKANDYNKLLDFHNKVLMPQRIDLKTHHLDQVYDISTRMKKIDYEDKKQGAMIEPEANNKLMQTINQWGKILNESVNEPVFDRKDYEEFIT